MLDWRAATGTEYGAQELMYGGCTGGFSAEPAHDRYPDTSVPDLDTAATASVARTAQSTQVPGLALVSGSIRYC